jgi:antitoxin (DNA-binding transcriptional repressor) of toxin-antitoxin stability system
MRFVTVRDFRTKSSEIWKTLPEEQEMVVTNNGKPVALLIPTTDRDVFDLIQDIAGRRAMAAMGESQRISKENGNDKMTLEEINEEIAAARREKKSKQ